MIGSERKSQVPSFESLFDNMDHSANLEYFSDIQKYFKTSLAVKGSLLSDEEYEVLCEESQFDKYAMHDEEIGRTLKDQDL